MQADILNTLNQMTNEFDLVFDYVPKDTIQKLHDYKKRLETDEAYFAAQTSNTYETLEPHHISILTVCNKQRKLKTADFQFLNDVVLFDGILKFDLFRDENKNTKETLVKYLHTLYMTSVVNTKAPAEVIELVQQQNTRAPHSLDALNGLLSNPVVSQLASDITNELQTQNVDPAALLSSIMSGKPNAQLNKLMGTITNKLEHKMSTGELDKDQLEKQAQHLMSSMGSGVDMSAIKNLLEKRDNN